MAWSSGSGERRTLYLCHRVSGDLLGYAQGHSGGIPAAWCEYEKRASVGYASGGHRIAAEDRLRGEMYPDTRGLIVGAGCGWT